MSTACTAFGSACKKTVDWFIHVLRQIKRRFQSGPLAGRAMTAGVGELDKDFGFVLAQQMVSSSATLFSFCVVSQMVSSSATLSFSPSV